MIINWTPIKAVLPDLAATIHNTQFTETDVVEFAFKAMEKIGTIEQYKPAMAAISVSNYKACLPTEAKQIVLMSYKDTTVSSTEEEIENIRRDLQVPGDTYYTGFSDNGWFTSEYRPLRLASSPYAISVHCTDCVNLHTISEHTYTITPDKCVTTSFRDGTICVVYTEHYRDSEGNYMIPDDEDYIDALRAYVLMRIWEYRMNMKEEGAAQLFAFYASRWDHMRKVVGGKMKMPSLDKLENIRQMINRLVPHERNYYRGFGHLPEEELDW